MKKLLFIISVFSLLSFTTWQPSFETAMKIAGEKHQPVLLNFSGSDWCGPCIRIRKEIFENDDLSLYAIDDGVRKFVSIESLDKELVVKSFNKFYKTYSELMNEEQEPMINLVSFYEEEYGWRIIIFLRAKHRPAVFFAEDESKMLISPAAIDLGGVCVFPREEDFNRITKEMITDIFKEVFIDAEKLDSLVGKLSLG